MTLADQLAARFAELDALDPNHPKYYWLLEHAAKLQQVLNTGDGGGGITQSIGLRGAPTLATLTPTQINAGATVAAAATTVRQRLLINNSDQPVYWNPGTVTPTATNYDHAIVPGGYLEPTYLGECRVFGVGLTAGELRIRDYS